jgi:hypothetical protein
VACTTPPGWKSLKIGFNRNYLLDVLEGLRGTSVTVHLVPTAGIQPVSFETAAIPRFALRRHADEPMSDNGNVPCVNNSTSGGGLQIPEPSNEESGAANLPHASVRPDSMIGNPTQRGFRRRKWVPISRNYPIANGIEL